MSKIKYNGLLLDLSDIKDIWQIMSEYPVLSRRDMARMTGMWPSRVNAIVNLLKDSKYISIPDRTARAYKANVPLIGEDKVTITKLE